MQRSLHHSIAIVMADLRRHRKAGRSGSQSRVLPIESNPNTIDPIKEYSHALIGEVQMGFKGHQWSCQTEQVK